MDDSPTRSSALVAPDHAGPQPGRRHRWHRPLAIGLSVATAIGLLAGCGGKDLDKDGKSAKEKLNSLGDGKETALSDDGKTPKRGGKRVMSLSGETNGGYCLPEAQLASGIQVAMSIYDTLTVPDYRGNRYFNTLGNMLAWPRAAILVPDFETGDLLHLQGRLARDERDGQPREYTLPVG